jgi:hypothetical protein
VITWVQACNQNVGCVEVGFHKAEASLSNGNCVEAGWGKSSASQDGNCVEAGEGACGLVHVRDSKDPGGPVLDFTRDEWTAFLAGVRNGEFDL